MLYAGRREQELARRSQSPMDLQLTLPGDTMVVRPKQTNLWNEMISRTRNVGSVSPCTASSVGLSNGSSLEPAPETYEPRATPITLTPMPRGPRARTQGEASGTVFGSFWDPRKRSPNDVLLKDVPPGQRALREAQEEYAQTNMGAFRNRPSSPNQQIEPQEGNHIGSSPPIGNITKQPDNNKQVSLRSDRVNTELRTYKMVDEHFLNEEDDPARQFIRKSDLEEIISRCVAKALSDHNEQAYDRERQRSIEQAELDEQRNREAAERMHREEQQAREEAEQREREASAQRRREEEEARDRRNPPDERRRAEELERHEFEAERIHRLFQMETDLQEWANRLGRPYVPMVQGLTANGTYTPARNRTPEVKAEYAKPELIGYLDPIAAHLPWDGSPTATDRQNTYISFNAWLTHLSAVIGQKHAMEYNRAVLDTASLHCLRGIALEWWMALDENEQEILRNDTELVHWARMGARLSKRIHAGRREAIARKRRPGETLVGYATAKLRMLRESFPKDREVRDTIKDIRDGLSVQDQIAIREDMQPFPQSARLMEELQRLGEIKAEEYHVAMRNLATRGTATPQHKNIKNGQNEAPKPNQRKARQPFVYDRNKVKMRTDPKNQGGPKIRTYEFDDGKIIWLERSCRHYGVKHFDFECDRRPAKPGTARAAPMELDDEDMVDCYLSMTADPASGDTMAREPEDDKQNAWDTGSAWDESAYSYLMAEN